MKRINLDNEFEFGSQESAGNNVGLDPMLENFLRQGNDKLEEEWKEGDPVVDPKIHPRDLQEMRAHRKPAEHIEPCDKEKSEEIYRDLLNSCGGPDIPDLHDILGWS